MTGSRSDAEWSRLQSQDVNRFFLWTRAHQNAAEVDPHGLARPGDGAANVEVDRTDFRYFMGIARQLDRLLPAEGITFLFTAHADRFEDRFRDAVVFLIGDEKHLVPCYADQVRAIFKTGGTSPNPLSATLALPAAVAWRDLLREGRNLWLRRRLMPAGQPAPMFEVPIGYFSLEDAPFVPIAERSIDVFFAGSIENERGFTVRPRLAARRHMLAGIRSAAARLPALRADCSSFDPFGDFDPEQVLDPTEYSSRLMQAKIALCPRGNIDETFRLIEAAKSGCVAIADQLPERWYYRRAPVISIGRWSRLPATLSTLLADSDALSERSELMRRWWSDELSESAVARFVAASLSPGRDRVDRLGPGRDQDAERDRGRL